MKGSEEVPRMKFHTVAGCEMMAVEAKSEVGTPLVALQALRRQVLDTELERRRIAQTPPKGFVRARATMNL